MLHICISVFGLGQYIKVYKILLGSVLFEFLKSKQSNKTIRHHLGGPDEGII